MGNDVEEAAIQYAELTQTAGTMLLFPTFAVDRIIALLAQTIGNLDDAKAHFEDSLTFCRKAGYQPELAWTCCDYADFLQERNGEGDRVKSASLLDESLTIAGQLNMRPLMERVLSRREILKA